MSGILWIVKWTGSGRSRHGIFWTTFPTFLHKHRREIEKPVS